MNNPKLKEIVLWLLSMKRPAEGANEKRVSAWLFGYLENLGCAPYRDQHGNVWVTLGQPSVIFTSHMDSVHSKDGSQELLIDKGIVRLAPPQDPDTFAFTKLRKKSDPSSPFWIPKQDRECLGADDAAGVAMMVHMIEHQVEGLYLFTVAEEIGSVGMSAWMKEQRELLDGITHAVAFDRRGTDDIVTHQHGRRMGSVGLAEALARQLNMDHSEAEGSHTDNALLEGLVSEIVNISVGYEHEHSAHETLDLDYLDRLGDAVLGVEWSALPVCEISTSMFDLYDLDPRLEDILLDLLDEAGIDPHHFDPFAQTLADALERAHMRGHYPDCDRARPLSSTWS